MGTSYVPPRDGEGYPIQKKMVAMEDMHYEPRSLDFVTSKYQSLYNRKNDGGGIYAGTDYGDAHEHFYDSTDTEMLRSSYASDAAFQTALDASCVKTICHFEPNFKYAIRSGVLMLREEWAYDGYMWCVLAPDIPEASGGNVPFLAGGYNLRFFPEKSYIRMDGETVVTVDPDPIYKSHVLGLVIKHNAGDKKGIQMIYEMYR